MPVYVNHSQINSFLRKDGQTNTAHPPSAFAPINLFAVFFSCVGRESPNSSLRLERGEGQANKDRVL
jgi:hypothetical protein